MPSQASDAARSSAKTAVPNWPATGGGKLLEDTTVPLVLLVLGPLLPTDIKSIVPTTIPGGLPGSPIGG